MKLCIKILLTRNKNKEKNGRIDILNLLESLNLMERLLKALQLPNNLLANLHLSNSREKTHKNLQSLSKPQQMMKISSMIKNNKLTHKIKITKQSNLLTTNTKIRRLEMKKITKAIIILTQSQEKAVKSSFSSKFLENRNFSSNNIPLGPLKSIKIDNCSLSSTLL